MAAEVSPHYAFSISVPDGWQSLASGNVLQAPQEVKALIDCAGEDPGETKLLGWKLSAGGAFEGAYCISYQSRGMGRLRELLRMGKGDEGQKAADKFLDSFASKLTEEYTRKRSMTLADLSGDLMRADTDVIMVMDGKVSGNSRQYLRGIVVYLHHDGLLNISSIYDTGASAGTKKALDDIPVSLKWQ